MRASSSLASLFAISLLAAPPAQAGWSDGGKLAAGVDSGNAFALSDGRVVSVGIPSLTTWWPATTQVWDPATNSWSKPASAPALPDIFQATPVLLDDGRILVTGFCIANCGKGSNAEIYDPVKDRWTVPGQMHTPRYLHVAVKLQSGRVLVMGGCSAYGCAADTATAEIYDPATRRFTKAAPMKAHRASFRATLLADGRVLVTGGYNSTGVMTENETYDPVADRWTVNAPMKHAHAVHVALLLKDGRVLAAGGDAGLGLPDVVADVFDPATGQWQAAGPMAKPREYFQGAALADGKALMIGGYSLNGEMFVTLKDCERFDPKKNIFVPAKPMARARTEFSTAVLPDGRVMAVGGDAYLNGETPVPGDAELYTP